MERNLARDTIMPVSTITGNFRYSMNVFIICNKFVCLCHRERKIFPLALINYITLSGGGFERESGTKLKNLTMKELIESVCYPLQRYLQKKITQFVNIVLIFFLV